MIKLKIYVEEKPIAHKKWTIEIHTNQYGTKFVTAKRETIYGTVLEVRIEKHERYYVPYEKNNHLIDSDELLKIRDEMLKVFKGYVTEKPKRRFIERNRW